MGLRISTDSGKEVVQHMKRHRKGESRLGSPTGKRSQLKRFRLALLLVVLFTVGCTTSTSKAPQEVRIPAESTASDTAVTAAPAPATETPVPIYRIAPRSEQVVNILLVGTDSRAVRAGAGGGNADTIILASYDRAAQVVTLVSFMRDMVVDVDGEYAKLKTAYRSGGMGSLINTLNAFFSLDIQGYVAIGLDGFATFVEDTLGGLDVELDAEEIDEINRRITDYEHETELIKNCPLVTDSPGHVHLNGVQTLVFVRNRSTSAAGGEDASDFDRAARQQEVLRLMFERFREQSPLASVPGLIGFALKHVETNLSADALYALAEPLMTGFVTVEGVSVPFEGAWEYGGDGSGILFDWEPTIQKLNERLYGAWE